MEFVSKLDIDIDFFMDMEKKKCFALIIYDIVNDKKRNQLVKYLEGYGYRVQKSAFEVRLNQALYREFVKRINFFKLGKGDSIRIYELKQQDQIKIWGKKTELVCDDIIII